jgi:hypothetical protein
MRGDRLAAFEARLEPGDLAQTAASGEGLDGAEVGVPAPVLIDRQDNAALLGEFDGGLGVGCGQREGLVDDDRQAEVERLPAERDVGVGRGRHRDGLGPGGNEPGEVVDHRGVGVLGGHERLPLGGPGHDRDELALGGGGDQWGVEVAGPEAVADQPEPYRGDRAPLRAGTHLRRFPLGSGGNPRASRPWPTSLYWSSRLRRSSAAALSSSACRLS